MLCFTGRMDWHGQKDLIGFGYSNPIQSRRAGYIPQGDNNMAEEKKAAPVHKVRVGNVVISVWAHKGEQGVFHNVSMEKNYTQDGEWKSSGNLNTAEIHKAITGLQQAYEWIMQQSKAAEKTTE